MTTANSRGVHTAGRVACGMQAETATLDELPRGQLDCIPAVTMLYDCALAPTQGLAIAVLSYLHRHHTAEWQQLLRSGSLSGRTVAMPMG